MSQTLRDLTEYLSDGGAVRIYGADGNGLNRATLHLLTRILSALKLIVRPA